MGTLMFSPVVRMRNVCILRKCQVCNMLCVAALRKIPSTWSNLSLGCYGLTAAARPSHSVEGNLMINFPKVHYLLVLSINYLPVI